MTTGGPSASPGADWASFLEGLAAAVGPEGISTDEPERTAYARDLWPRTLIGLQRGDVAPAPPDVIVWPRTPAQVAAVVRLCGAHGVPLVPYGAGSGVCGAAMAVSGGVMLDLKRMRRLRRVAPERGVVEAEAGIIGQHLEDALQATGLTLGHFPSSIWCSTLGGWLATRSGGQCSSRYGKIEDMCVSLEVVTGDGEIRTTPPAGAPGSGVLDFNRLFIGSEGAFGVITAATLRVSPILAHRQGLGASLPTLEAGIKAMRRIMQRDGEPPSVLRLYDPFDSLLAGHDGGGESRRSGPLGAVRQALLGPSAARDAALRLALQRPGPINTLGGLARRCRLIAIYEGDRFEAVERGVEGASRIITEGGGEVEGPGPAEAWLAHRHDTGFKQSELYAAGAFVDTLEVATTWAGLRPLYAAVRKALSPYGLVMAHFSHAYREGCSIYFTFIGSGEDAEARGARYDEAWAEALAATAAAGGCIAHHHGVGLARGVALQATQGPAERWFAALKRALDPHGVLNPGKLFDAPGPRWEETR